MFLGDEIHTNRLLCPCCELFWFFLPWECSACCGFRKSDVENRCPQVLRMRTGLEESAGSEDLVALVSILTLRSDIGGVAIVAALTSLKYHYSKRCFTYSVVFSPHSQSGFWIRGCLSWLSICAEDIVRRGQPGLHVCETVTQVS